jgi:hypothetical protein
VGLAGVVEDGCGAKVDELDDVLRGHDTVVEFEVAVGEPHFVEVLYAVAYLTKDAVDLWATHLSGHDYGKEIKGCELHDLIIVAMVKDDIDGLYDVGVFEGGTDTEFGGDFLLVLLFGLACALRTKLLDGIDVAAVLALDKTNGAACATAEDAAPLAVLFGKVGLGCVVEGCDGMVGV